MTGSGGTPVAPEYRFKHRRIIAPPDARALPEKPVMIAPGARFA